MSLPELSEQDRNWYILKGYEITEIKYWRVWLLNGVIHREDGPAIEYIDGRHEWWLNGEKMSEEEHRKAVIEIKVRSELSDNSP